MNLSILPYSAISDAFATASSTGREQTVYNTNHHTSTEISTALPHLTHQPPSSIQPWVLLSPWLPIVTSTQGLPRSSVHLIRLSGPFLALLTSAFKVGIYIGRMNASDAEDLDECFPRTTTRGVPLSELFAGGKYFARLDTSSLKDAADGGQGAVTSVEQLWTRLATSARACQGIRSLRAQDEDVAVYVYLFPWNKGMKTSLEYRVFCPPDRGRIAAVSQYRWHEPWVHAEKGMEEQKWIAERVWRGAEEVYERLLASESMTESMRRKEGFTFDVCEDGKGGVMLIELNGFGAMNGCGSCLYHWIRDAKVLYGLEEKVEFRVAV